MYFARASALLLALVALTEATSIRSRTEEQQRSANALNSRRREDSARGGQFLRLSHSAKVGLIRELTRAASLPSCSDIENRRVGQLTCGYRIKSYMDDFGYSVKQAVKEVVLDGYRCNCKQSASWVPSLGCMDETDAGRYTCGARIRWRMGERGGSHSFVEALMFVRAHYPRCDCFQSDASDPQWDPLELLPSCMDENCYGLVGMAMILNGFHLEEAVRSAVRHGYPECDCE